jgi:hypothetical protein
MPTSAAGSAGDEANRKRLLQSFLFITQMQQGRCYQSALSYWRRLRANAEALTMGESEPFSNVASVDVSDMMLQQQW